MGKVVKVIKTLYGKIDWGVLKNTLMKLLNLKIVIKESNTVIKFDKKFIREYIHSTYTAYLNYGYKKK